MRKKNSFIYFLVCLWSVTALSADPVPTFVSFTKEQFQTYLEQRWRTCCQRDEVFAGQKEFEFFVLSKYHLYRYSEFCEFARTLKRYKKFMKAVKEVLASNAYYAQLFYPPKEQEYVSLAKWFTQENARIVKKERFTQAIVQRLESKGNYFLLGSQKKFVRYPKRESEKILQPLHAFFPFDDKNIFEKFSKGLSVDFVDLELYVLTQYRLYANDDFREMVQCLEYYDEFVKAFALTTKSDSRFPNVIAKLAEGEDPDMNHLNLFHETLRYKLKRNLLGQATVEEQNPAVAAVAWGVGVLASSILMVFFAENHDRRYYYYYY